ncbi:MAG: excinuclease ABC subunit C [Coxiella sp. (in: Bacteria)]|nr:MAG: excinuclease ABC subunit C [Coxiella sp. (in: g-proteobacteria)]
MLNAENKILYVGKARDLKKRLASYFRDTGLSTKTQVLMRQVVDVKTIITASDTEALLLESNLIKEYRPRYNVLLRDDKSYPYLYLDTEQDFPRLDFYRGAHTKKGRYFGPYPTAGAVRDNLALLQKLFQIRQCKDSFFKHRSRPCLQHQIKRCTAPCVARVSKEAYAQQVEHAVLFLEGKNDRIIKNLERQMDAASNTQAYELAAHYRDQIVRLRQLQETQCISGKTGNVDIIGVALGQGRAAVNVVFVRQGRLLGQRLYFPQVGIADDVPTILNSFLLQYYFNSKHADEAIDKIVLSDKLPDKVAMQQVLQTQLGTKLVLTDFRGALYKQWQQMAKTNAQHGLATHLADKESALEKLLALQKALALKDPIQRIECFDISHTMGEATVASCVVYDAEGAKNKEYRRFNIKDIEAGDDYAAMAQVLMRRYKKLKTTDQILPDVVLIDGGKGQLKKAIDVFEELQLSDIQLVGVSKGPARKPGQEQLWLPGRTRPLQLATDSMALHLIQFVRDESHRFAITTHRQQRAKKRTHSSLEDIAGVGPKRRRDLLRYFGGIQQLRDASITEIAKVSGISEQLAKSIYDLLH